MKRFCRVTALLMVLLIAASVLAGAAMAEGYKVKALTKGKWYTLTSEAKTNVLYKMTLKKDSYLFLEAENITDDSVLEFELYTRPDGSWDNYCGGCGMGGGGRCTLVLAKGTYYIKTYNNACTPKLKLTVEPLPKITNTTRGKAIRMKSGQDVRVPMLAGMAGSRWYKIKTTRKQAIRVNVVNIWETEFNIIEIYDAKGNKLPVKYDENEWTVTTKRSLKAGRYYIRVNKPRFNYKQDGGYIDMMWS